MTTRATVLRHPFRVDQAQTSRARYECDDINHRNNNQL